MKNVSEHNLSDQQKINSAETATFSEQDLSKKKYCVNHILAQKKPKPYTITDNTSEEDVGDYEL